MLDSIFIVVGVIAAACAVLVVVASSRPDTFRVARTVGVAAPTERVFALINDLAAMNTWNPFDKQDPNIKGTYSGPASGVGAHYDFDSRKAGTGYIEILESKAPSHVRMRLFMTRPMACDHRIDFTIEPRGASTDVTWAITGRTPLIGKVMNLFCSMDRMIGGTFEKGLADLKAIAEGGRAA